MKKKKVCHHFIVRCSCGIAVRHCGCVASGKEIIDEPNSCAFCRHQEPDPIEELPSVETPYDDDEVRDL
jgi:hypothetical protein